MTDQDQPNTPQLYLITPVGAAVRRSGPAAGRCDGPLSGGLLRASPAREPGTNWAALPIWHARSPMPATSRWSSTTMCNWRCATDWTACICATAPAARYARKELGAMPSSAPLRRLAP